MVLPVDRGVAGGVPGELRSGSAALDMDHGQLQILSSERNIRTCQIKDIPISKCLLVDCSQHA